MPRLLSCDVIGKIWGQHAPLAVQPRNATGMGSRLSLATWVRVEKSGPFSEPGMSVEGAGKSFMLASLACPGTGVILLPSAS